MGLIIDNFAGGGGASTGIEMALGRSPDIAINHSAEALAMHARNHPGTVHLVSDVWEVDPVELCKGRPVDLAWFSPDCTHHSRAKGGKPIERKGAAKSRALAWVVIRYARTVKPKVIMLENVPEFLEWGPLDAKGKRIKRKAGLTFRIWLGKLRAQGYQVEMRKMRASDYGAPTSRARLFIIARCDGEPIVWPSPTHGPGTWKPWRTAAECIDWSLPCPSIFGRRKPLVPATLRRIARGIEKFVMARTARPFLVQRSYGERKGQAPRCMSIDEPLGTAVAGGIKHALVVAFVARHFGGKGTPGAPMQVPLHTITCVDHHALVTATLGDESDQVRAFLTRYNGKGEGQPAQLSLQTVTTRDRFGVVVVHGQEHRISDIGMRMLTPRELFLAQGFPEGYDIRARTKTEQVKLVGNSVSPPIAAALVRANLGHLVRRERGAAA